MCEFDRRATCGSNIGFNQNRDQTPHLAHNQSLSGTEWHSQAVVKSAVCSKQEHIGSIYTLSHEKMLLSTAIIDALSHGFIGKTRKRGFALSTCSLCNVEVFIIDGEIWSLHLAESRVVVRGPD
jgi:hypothetical protein